MRELRPYQQEAMQAVLKSFDAGNDRVLISLPTGVGKGTCGAWLIAMWPDICKSYNRPERCLWLAHRDELVWQGADDINEMCGEPPAVEKGEQTIFKDAKLYDRRVVVSSIQTLARTNRREKFGPDQFGLIVHDESHHIPADSHTEVIEYFGAAKLLGMTATCDRTDQISLGRVFQDVAHHYELLDAINDGWLAPINQQYITVEDVDFSKVGKDASGDISATDMGRIYREEDVLHRVIAPTVKLAGDRQTMLFAPTVASAEAFAVMLERYGRTAVAVSGRTPEEERREAVEKYKAGEIQYLVNCALYLEGFNAPATSCVVIARSTNSRMLYAQILGRGLRGGPKCPIPGKTDLLVLDLVGASLKHKLVHAADLLGGKYDEVVVEAANQAVQQKSDEGTSADVMAELLAAAAKADELKAAQRRRILAEAKVSAKTIDPFSVFSDVPVRHVPAWWKDTPATIEQCEHLESQGIKVEGRFSFAEARQLQQEVWRRQRDGLCSYKDARQLNARGFDPCMSAKQAKSVLAYLGKRPGGYKFMPEDGKRRAIRKKKLKSEAEALEHGQ